MVDPRLVAFLRDGERRHLSRNTLDDRRRLIARFVQWLEPRTVLDAGREDIEAWLDTLPIGPRSRYSYISTLASFYAFLEETGVRDDDPTRRIRRPKLGRLLPRPISDGDLEYALSVADDRMRCWLLLAALDGLRCSEIANLRREDVMVDHDPPIIVVRQGKGRKDRIVPLNPLVEEALRSYGLRSGYLFHLNDGSRIGPRTVSCYISRFLHSHGVDASAHRGRHKFGTDAYAESGGDLRLVQEMMGHSDPKTTAIYADFDPQKAAAVVRRLGARKGSARGPGRGDRPDESDSAVHPAEGVVVELESSTHLSDDLTTVDDSPVAHSETGRLDLVPAVACQKDAADGGDFCMQFHSAHATPARN